MKKLALIVGLLSVFFAAAIRVDAACDPAKIVGISLNCKDPNPVRCPVGGPGGGALLCCLTPAECDEKKIEIKQRQAEAAAGEPKILEVCEFAGDKKGDCEACFKKDPPETWSAIGCIPTNPQEFISKFLGFGIGVGGGIAFLLILFGGLQIMTSAGNPEKLNAGKELVSAAISGLLLIIFSLFLLRLIGYNILGIPGFG